MKKVIWKYQIPETQFFTLQMPRGAEILTLQMQYGQPTIWALVDPLAENENRRFAITGTGHEFTHDKAIKYIDTFQINGGTGVYHLFETDL